MYARLFAKGNTVKTDYEEPAYTEPLVIGNWFHSPIFTKELVNSTFISNGYMEQIFKVPISSL